MHPFDLTIPLRIVTRGVCEFDGQGFAHLLHQFPYKLLPAVRMDGLRDSIPGEYLSLQGSYGGRCCCLGEGEGFNPFRKGILTGEDVLST